MSRSELFDFFFNMTSVVTALRLMHTITGRSHQTRCWIWAKEADKRRCPHDPCPVGFGVSCVIVVVPRVECPGLIGASETLGGSKDSRAPGLSRATRLNGGMAKILMLSPTSITSMIHLSKLKTVSLKFPVACDCCWPPVHFFPLRIGSQRTYGTD